MSLCVSISQSFSTTLWDRSQSSEEAAAVSGMTGVAPVERPDTLAVGVGVGVGVGKGVGSFISLIWRGKTGNHFLSPSKVILFYSIKARVGHLEKPASQTGQFEPSGIIGWAYYRPATATDLYLYLSYFCQSI